MALTDPEMASVDETGEVVLVTGAAGGLGEAISAAFVARGARVVVSDLDGEAAERVAVSLREQGGRAESVQLDASSRTDVESTVDKVVAGEGRLDVVVSLAGVVRNDFTTAISDEDFRLVMATHVDGTLNAMRAALPHMKERGYGRLVNMSSVAVRGSLGGGSYAAAKGAIEGLTRSAAMESARYGVTVNCVAPGLVDAGMFRAIPEEFQEKFAGRVPMRRVARPDEIAAVVAFFASREASYVTGQSLYVCGGSSLGF
ncbi:SDR family oxidoreductase [Pseudonocardia ailaonensis]|uniref:SDR family oxidoreductase n=1 Tax=Pseudonocardia ailaonensis TaxID=367279 RepID=A0ABN2N4K3_9PSEU